MIDTTTAKDRRAQITANIGLVLQIVLCAALLLTFVLFTSRVVLAAARWMAGGMVIWLTVALVYAQRRRTAEERLEAEELKRTQQATGATAIFDVEDEAYLVERRRLNWLLRWLVPAAVLALAVYHLAGTFVGWGWGLRASLEAVKWEPTKSSGPAMAFVGGVGFVAFLFSRYAAGMARERGWRLLRAGASYMAGNALSCLVVLAAIALQSYEVPRAEMIAAQAIRIAMFVLGIEFLVNLLLDFYRPRQAGVESRPAFDSRLLGLISEPGGIARSIADAINYQFGFEVSKTWFYQLLKRAALPMVVFMFACLLALSGVLIVDADERVIVERFGRRLQPVDAPLKPGLHLKYPWPIDIAYRTRVEEVRALTVGDSPTEQGLETVKGVERPKPVLWGQEHKFNPEMMLVVATPELTNLSAGKESDNRTTGGKAVAVGLLMVSVDIQYCVKDLYQYLYKFTSPEKMVEAIAYQVLTDYAAQVDVERFMGAGRAEINAELATLLQKRLDELELGIGVLFVGLQEAHPTPDVAKSFQQVVAAERKKSAAIEEANGQAERMLTEAAGNRARAMLLYEAIMERERLAQQAGADPAAAATADRQVSDLLLGNPEKGIAPTSGQASRRIAEAQAAVQAAVTQATTDLQVFDAELAAFQAAPDLYRTRKYLGMLTQSVQSIRKYILAVDTDKTKVIVEFEPEQKGTIDIGEAPRK